MRKRLGFTARAQGCLSCKEMLWSSTPASTHISHWQQARTRPHSFFPSGKKPSSRSQVGLEMRWPVLGPCVSIYQVRLWGSVAVSPWEMRKCCLSALAKVTPLASIYVGRTRPPTTTPNSEGTADPSFQSRRVEGFAPAWGKRDPTRL